MHFQYFLKNGNGIANFEPRNFSSSVEKCLSELYFNRKIKKNFVSLSGHVIFYLLHRHQWNTKSIIVNVFFFVVERGYLLSKHSKGDLSVRLEDDMFFSHVRKILEGLCFHPVAHLVFHWDLCNKIRLHLFAQKRTTWYIMNLTFCSSSTDHPFRKPAKLIELLIELKTFICFICC